MPLVTIDLTKYVDRVGARVDPGRYRLRVVYVEVGPSKAGSQMITMNLAVVGGPFDGSVIIDRLTLTDKAMFRVVNFLQALGIATPRKRLQIDPDAWVDRIVEADLADGEPYRNTIKSEIQGYIKPERASADAASTEDDLDKLLPSEVESAVAGPQDQVEDVDLDSIKL